MSLNLQLENLSRKTTLYRNCKHFNRVHQLSKVLRQRKYPCLHIHIQKNRMVQEIYMPTTVITERFMSTNRYLEAPGFRDIFEVYQESRNKM